MFSGNSVACGLCRFSVLQILFLEVLNRVVSIFAGVMGGLNGLIASVQKCKSYIDRQTAAAEKDPSASLQASDGSADDCLGNQ